MEENKTNVSHSKQKRLDRQKLNSKKKMESTIWKIVGVVAIIAVIAIVALIITSLVKKASETLTPSSDFSAKLDDNGFISGVTAKDYIDVCDYKNIVVPLADVEYPDASVEEDIQSALSSHQVLRTEDVEAKDGDKVNIDYVGTIDGVEFDGGNTNGNGSDVTIGSGSLIDDFEQQLIGYKPGEVITVSVTFPEDYQATELAGKDAEFTVTMNGVYEDPEFDDDFVCAYYSDVATTTDEYREYLKTSNYEDNLMNYVTDYVSNNSSVKKYPKSFLKNIKETTMYGDQESFEYMNQMYEQYYGAGFTNFQEYTGMTDEQYMANLDTECKDRVRDILAYQAILENEGITLTDADLKAYYDDMYGSEDEETYNNLVEEYGKGYLMLDIIKEKALDIVKGNTVVE